ncbi:MAG: hypothetical protein HY329_13925 [Chloroflexi bacterium]|nr:hypothetical protein [Chloroflexota bacterium]
MAVGVLLRCWSLLGPFAVVDSDQAIVGLQALHVWQREWLLVDWDNPRHGALETYLTALAFGALGVSGLALRLPPALFSLLLIPLFHALGRAAYSPRVGLWSAAFVAIPPPLLLRFGLFTGAGYVEVLAGIGLAASLALSLRAVGGSGELLKTGAIGLVLGASIWTNQVALPFAVVVSAAVVLRWLLWWRSGTRGIETFHRALVLGLGYTLGLAPLVAYNVANDWQLLTLLSQRRSGPGEVASLVQPFVVTAWPTLWGLLPPTSHPKLFEAHLDAAWLREPVAATATAAAALWLGGHWLLTRLTQRPTFRAALADGLLIGGSALTVVAYLLNVESGLVATEPRYLVPVYALIPVALAVYLGPDRAGSSAPSGWSSALDWRAALLGTLLLCYLVFSLTLDRQLYSVYAGPEGEIRLPPTTQALRADLASHGVTAAYADYWIAYQLMFESREAVAVSVIDEQLEPGWNRYEPYAQRVAGAPRPAWIFAAGVPEERRFAEWLSRHGIGSERREIGGFVVYGALARPVRPTPGGPVAGPD